MGIHSDLLPKWGRTNHPHAKLKLIWQFLVIVSGVNKCGGKQLKLKLIFYYSYSFTTDISLVANNFIEIYDLDIWWFELSQFHGFMFHFCSVLRDILDSMFTIWGLSVSRHYFSHMHGRAATPVLMMIKIVPKIFESSFLK